MCPERSARLVPVAVSLSFKGRRLRRRPPSVCKPGPRPTARCMRARPQTAAPLYASPAQAAPAGLRLAGSPPARPAPRAGRERKRGGDGRARADGPSAALRARAERRATPKAPPRRPLNDARAGWQRGHLGTEQNGAGHAARVVTLAPPVNTEPSRTVRGRRLWRRDENHNSWIVRGMHSAPL